MSRLRTALTIALAALGSVPAAARAQKTVPGFEQGLFELAARNLPRTVILTLVDSAGHVLLPAQAVLQAIGIGHTREPARLTAARMSGKPAAVDLRSQRLVAGIDTMLLSRQSLQVSADEVYLAPEALALLLEAEVQVDFPSLAVGLRRDRPFPAEQLALASIRREVMLARERYEARASRLRRLGFQPGNGIGVLDWNLSTTGSDPWRSALLGTRVGAAVWGGSMVLTQRFRAEGSVERGPGESLFEYHRVFPASSWVRQLRVGDITTDGLVSRVVRGVSLTNAPEYRASEYSQLLVQPDIPTGWQYEVIQSGRLLGYADGGTRTAVPVPVQIGGSAPVIVHMYGPAGQDLTRELVYYTPVELLPLGRLEYGLGAGSCRSALCSSYGYADVRYGLSRKLTIGFGGERLDDSTRAVIRPSAEMSFTTGTRLIGELRAVKDAMVGGTLTAHGSGTTASLRGDYSYPGYSQLTVLSGDLRQWTGGVIMDQRLPFRRIFGLRVEANAAGADALDRWSASLAALHGAGQTEVRMEAGDLTPRMLILRSNIFMPTRLRQKRWAPLVTGVVGASSRSLQTAQLALSARAVQNGLISTNVRWERATGTHVEVGFSGTISAVQAFLRATSAPGALMGTSASLGGSAAYAPGQGMAMNPFPRVGFGGVHGRLFHDLDGDGRFGQDDEPVADARVIVGEIPVMTDAKGFFNAWGNRPYAVTSIALDSLSTGDPSWITAQAEQVIRLNPNMSLEVDLPLIRTREVAGRLVASAEVATSAGVTVELVPANDDGGEPIRTVTFSDGEFYFSRVRPGRYRLAVAQSSLTALGAAVGEGASLVTIPQAGGSDILELAPLRLVPKP